MANFSKTITNSIRVFGNSPSSKWGAMSWGVDYWGDGSIDLATRTMKLISNAIIPDSAVAKMARIYFSESVSASFELSDEYLSDGAGYLYVFNKPTTNADQQVITTYISLTADTTNWNEGTSTDTDWS